jgi:hypothetical protein
MKDELEPKYKKLVEGAAENIVDTAFFPKDLKYVEKYAKFYMEDLTVRVLKKAEEIAIQRKEAKP